MAPLAPVGAQDHAHREGGAILGRTQRAQIVGNALGQHRHDAVGEIDRIAALLGFLVERGARAHVMRDVGDRDGEDEAAGIGRVRIRRRMDRVVVVPGVGRIDGHERKIAPVLPMGHGRGPRGLGVGERGRRKHMRDVVRGERDEADRALGMDRAEAFDDAPGGQAEAALAQHFERDEIAFGRVGVQPLRNEDFARGAALLDRQHAPGAVFQLAIDAERARARLVENLDDAAAIGGLLGAGFGVEFDAHQHARAQGRRRAAFASEFRAAHLDSRRLAGFAPIRRARDQFAVAIALDDVGDDHRRQPALPGEGLAAAGHRAVDLQILDEQFQRGLVFAFDAEGARDFALGDARRRLLAARRLFAGNEGEQFVARGQGARRGGPVLGFCARRLGAHRFGAGDASGFHTL